MASRSPKLSPKLSLTTPPSTAFPTAGTDLTPGRKPKKELDMKNYGKKDLLRLLCFMEAELQARDVALAVSKVNIFGFLTVLPYSKWCQATVLMFLSVYLA